MHPVLRFASLLLLGAVASGCGLEPAPSAPPASCDEPAGSAHDVTLLDLLEETWDLERLAKAQEPSFRSFQASSYDRSSETPEDPHGWFANVDRGHMSGRFQRNGRTEYVLLDASGPGALLRIWSAGLSATAGPEGTLRIYLDCDEEPRLEVELAALLEGRVAPWTAPFAYDAVGGGNFYFPIPFDSRALVTVDAGAADPDKGLYYHLGYRLYEEGTRVETFERFHLERDAGAIAEAREALLQPAAFSADPTDTATLSAASSAIALEASGPAAIVRLTLTPNLVTEEALRRTLLMITFDGVETVRAPLGDFFASGLGLNPVETLAFTVQASGELTTRFVMPFEREASVAIAAPPELAEEMLVEVAATVVSLPEPTPNRFFAQYRSSGIIDSGRQDFPFADLRGAGHYVGNTLTVTNPVPVWWGEGDEKIYVDDETFPSTFGTGTEDYYGYAWLNALFFEQPYHAQPRPPADPEHRGITSLHRTHMLDPIPFRSRLRFDMEIWHWWPRIELVYDTVQYWYAPATASHDFEPLSPAELKVPDLEVLDATWE